MIESISQSIRQLATLKMIDFTGLKAGMAAMDYTNSAEIKELLRIHFEGQPTFILK
jgi:hypothetical protein